MPAQRLPKYTILLDPATKAFQRHLRAQSDVSFSAFLRELIAHVADHPELEEAILERCAPSYSPATDPAEQPENILDEDVNGQTPAVSEPPSVPEQRGEDGEDEATAVMVTNEEPAPDVDASETVGAPESSADQQTLRSVEEDAAPHVSTPAEVAGAGRSGLDEPTVTTPDAPQRPTRAIAEDWDFVDDTTGPSPDEEPELPADDGFWA